MISKEEAALISSYILAICGISLDESKMYLLDARLGPILAESGCRNYRDLYFKAKGEASKALERRIIDAITTGETMFFRDTAPFELLQHKILPEIIDRRERTGRKGPGAGIRIWSAACSSGQEVYTVAMILSELLGMPATRFNPQIVATDISDGAIARASRGVFGKLEIERGLPKEKLGKYFQPHEGGWKVRDELRALASFRRLNLLEDFSSLGKFDVIFCRNVAIYFEEKDKVRLFDRLSRCLEPEGALIIGSTESLLGICNRFESRRYLRSVFYQLAGTGAPKPAPVPALKPPALVPVLA